MYFRPARVAAHRAITGSVAGIWLPPSSEPLRVPLDEPQAKVPKRKSAEKRTPKSKVVSKHGQGTDDELDDCN
ncbi:hypothetical protein T492DRAFT_882225 [Pavlovales sp. CCMP2436]|nr:hypothetical protein T492DRAFT_882225 [Pavlovales sp. CCMP2436]